MKNNLVIIALAVIFLSSVTGQTVKFPGGRIAMTSDGNQHDHDDYAATALSCALISTAGLSSKFVHYDFSNHLGDNNPKMEAQMIISAIEGAKVFGLDTTRIFNDQTQLDAAIKNFVKEANKSSKKNPLWFICAGPMETAWRCINATKPSKRKYIYCISHSGWNNKHHDTPEMTHTWDDVAKLGCKIINIKDQNPGTNRPYAEYEFLKNSSDKKMNWLWERGNSTGKPKFDPSDAGMAWWLITGGTNGGDEDANPEKFKSFLIK